MLANQVVIIGGGPAGASAALFLAKAGIASTILEKETFPRDKICGDALSGKVVEVLRKLHPEWLEELQVSEQFLGSFGVTFIAPNTKALRVPFKTQVSVNQPAPGFISKRIHFDNWLMEKMRREPLITIHENTVCRKFDFQNGVWNIQTASHTFTAPLIIAADGAYSGFAKHVGKLQTEPSHNCFGLRAYYQNVEGLDPQNFIELHFLKEFLPGYFWIFPLPGGGANVGVGMRADVVSKKKVNLKKAFEDIVANHPTIAPRFRHAIQDGAIKAYGLPLGSKVRQLSGRGYMLCGDAGMLIDPFTGEGIGNALMSGMIAARQTERAMANKSFEAAELQQYDTDLYARLGQELHVSYRMQQLVKFPWLFNFVVNKANSNAVLRQTISCMFEDMDMRAQLKDPRFYLKLLMG